MFARTLDEHRDLLRDAGLRLCWRQWSAIGASASGTDTAEAQSIIDPEALVLFSLSMRHHERRLTDFSAWLASAASHLLSVQRAKSLVQGFDDSALRLFAHMASESGDRRWMRIARGAESRESWRTGKGLAALHLDGPAALTLRLRAGFGPGTRADILSFLLGSSGGRATVREIADAAGYTATSIRAALNDLEWAQFVDTTQTHPAKYAASAKWGDLLETDSSELTWRDWPGMFLFVWDSIVALEQASPDADRYLVATSLRDIFERHAVTFERNRIPVDEGQSARGAAYIEVFFSTLRMVIDWADRNV